MNPLNIIPIESLDDPRTQVFMQMGDKQLRRDQKILVDSPKVVCRMIAEGQYPETLLASESFIEEQVDMLASIPNLTIFTASRERMESIVGHKLHHGVIALAKRPMNLELGNLGSKILVLNGVNKAENVGSMIRSADCFGIDSILVGPHALSPFVRRAIRVSMGSVFRLKIRHSESLQADLMSLQAKGFEVLGTGNYEASKSLYEHKFKEKSVLVIGSEGFGMDVGLRSLCDEMIRIPIQDRVDSLNAGIAAGVCLFEMARPTD